MGPTLRNDPTTQRIMSERSYHGATSRSVQDWASRAVAQRLQQPGASTYSLPPFIFWNSSVGWAPEGCPWASTCLNSVPDELALFQLP